MKVKRTGREDLAGLINVKSKDFMQLVRFCAEEAPDKKSDEDGLRKIGKMPYLPVKRGQVEAIVRQTGAEYTFDDRAG